MIGTRDLLELTGASAFDLDNWVRYNHVSPTFDADRRRQFNDRAAVIVAVMVSLRGVIPPGVSCRIGACLADFIISQPVAVEKPIIVQMIEGELHASQPSKVEGVAAAFDAARLFHVYRSVPVRAAA